MKDIVIIGAGGFAREVLQLIQDINAIEQEWRFLGFIDDNVSVQGTIVNGYPVLGTTEWLKDKDVAVAIAIGNPKSKETIYNKIKDFGNSFPNLIHPNALIGDFNQFGMGNIITAGSILTVNIELHNFIIININTTIGHDVVMEDYCTILPSVCVSGNVHLEKAVMMGTKSAIIQQLKIGAYSIIGAGATVTKDIPGNCTAVGTPAKVIKEN